jgi:heavy metal efflux system protein
MLVMVGAIGLALAGGWAFRQLKLEAYPDISDPSVVVITQYPGSPPKRSSSR